MIKIKSALRHATFIFNFYKTFGTNKMIFKDIAQSSYYKPIMKVQDFLNKQNIRYETGQLTYRIRQCVFCKQPHYNDVSKLHTLNVDKNDGKFLCSRCQKKGSWEELKAKILNIQENGSKQLLSAGTEQRLQQISQSEYTFLMNNLKKLQYADVLQYIKSRGFNIQTLQKYKIGAGTQTFTTQFGKQIQVKVIYFPMYQKYQNQNQKVPNDSKLKLKLTKIKVRGASTSNKKFSRQFPSGPQSGFFGLNTVSENDKTIVITQGQFDAMAVYQQTGLSTISLPQGANSLPSKLIPMLNQFQKIILWMDNDAAGKLGAERISYKLGSTRTYIVKHDIPNLKDANDFLKNCPLKMKQLLQNSKTKPGQYILGYADVMQSVRHRIFNHESLTGIQIECIPFFNKKVKGIRMQELTIVSGPTGCGKTTFLSQLSLDLCQKGIPVLWGSFQIRNQILVSNMLMQYSGVNLMKNKNAFDHYAEQFKQLPCYWLNFHGSNDVDKVLATIQYSIQKHNISFVVLDTLQFMLSDQAQGIQKFDLQDKVMSRLRKIATNYNVHIAIVIHPRKTQDTQDIQIYSIYGTSKAAQQADNIWMIQKRENFRLFDIKKNRYDGDIGKVALGYDKQLRRFLQLDRSQLLSLFNKQSTIQDIIKQRAQQKSNSQSSSSLNKENNNQDSFSLQQCKSSSQNQIQDDIINMRKKKQFRKND